MADKGLEEVPESKQHTPNRSHARLRDFEAGLRPPVFARLTCLRSLGQIESNYDEVTDSFDSMNLKAELLRGV